jgi:MFS family permease
MSDTLTEPERIEGDKPVRPNAIVAVLAVAGVVVALMQTVVIPIIGDLPQLLSTTAEDAAWVVTVTLLAAAVATPMFGRLGDMFGKRRMLLISLGLLVVGSIICGLSDTLAPMLVGRLLQGMASGVIPLGISVMRDVLPRERLSTATALMSASLGIGAAVGLPAAAFAADNFDWHILFWTSGALGALAAVCVLWLVPESSVRSGGRFDFIGAVGMGVGLVCLLLGVSKGASWGWGSATTISLFAGAVVVLLAWGWFELRTSEPLVDLRTTVRPQVLFTNLAGLVFGFSLFGIQLILPQILQLPEATGYGMGKSLVEVGLVMAPQGLVIMVVAGLSAKISNSRGPKITLMIGALVVAVGYALNLFMMSEVWQLVLVSCIIGAGIGFAYGALPLLIMSGVPVSETAAANGLNALLRAIGTSLASALVGVVLAQMTIDVGGHALPSEDSFKVIMAIGCAAALVALALASLLPKQRLAAEGVSAPAR